MGPSGEFIIDYSIYDALSAGFSRVVFIIKRENEALFREKIGERVAPRGGILCVPGYLPPAGRRARRSGGAAGKAVGHRPRGHVLPGGGKGPFAVINADDYYGPRCFRLLYDFLTGPQPQDGRFHLAMAGFVLKNTLTENGSVSRGVCAVDGKGISPTSWNVPASKSGGDGAAFTEDGGETWTPLSPDCTVSMNCWAFPAGTLHRFGELFREFLLDPSRDLKKAEFYLPYVVDRLVAGGEADVRVLPHPPTAGMA